MDEAITLAIIRALTVIMCPKNCGNTLRCTDAKMTGVQNPRKLGQN